MHFDVAIHQAIIVSAANGYQPFVGSVGVKDGRIAWVTEGKIGKSECDRWIDGTNRILMPGLVNAHCHGDMTLARGLGDDLTLLEQNQTFADTNWFYTLISDEDRFASRQLTYCEALLSGTTFMMENMYWGLGERSVEAMAQTGIKGALAEDVRMDFAKPDLLWDHETLIHFRNACERNGLVAVAGGISEEDYEPERLKRIKKKVTECGLRQTFHLAENDWRLARIQETFGCGSVKFLHQQGILDEHTIGSHVVYLTDEEIGLLAETGVKVANTPLCEMKIADGIAPIPKMVRAGVTVCLGTDGAMWNNSNDIFREMKGMALLHSVHSGIRSLKTTDLLDMATVNGAKAFGLEEQFGTIEEGKSADFILVRTDCPHMRPLRMGLCENVTSSLVFSATGNDVSDVFVNGIHVVEHGVLTTVNVDHIMETVQSAAEKITRK